MISNSFLFINLLVDLLAYNKSIQLKGRLIGIIINWYWINSRLTNNNRFYWIILLFAIPIVLPLAILIQLLIGLLYYIILLNAL